MTESLNQILRDINSGKKDKEFLSPKDSFNLFDHLTSMNDNQKENEKNYSNNTNSNNYSSPNINNSNNNTKNAKSNNNNSNNNSNNNNNNNLKINFNLNDKQRFSFMMANNEINSSPKFWNKAIEKNVSLKALTKLTKNPNDNNLLNSINNTTNNTTSHDKGSNQKRKSDSNNNVSKTISCKNVITTPNKKKIDLAKSI